MNYTVLQNNFISGEISPLMEGRVDSARYQTGLSLCENFLPIRQGGLKRRPGTHYAGNTKSDAQAILVPFLTSTGTYYIFEFTNLLVRFWEADYTLKMTGETVDSLVTPYTLAQLPYVKFAVNKGVMWIVHPSHAPRTITLTAGTFVLATPSFTGDRTFDSATNYPSIIAFRGGRLYLGATQTEPNAIFASRTPLAGVDSYTDFDFGPDAEDEDELLPTHAIYLQDSDMYGTSLNWLMSMNRLVAGSGRSVWMDTGEIATPETFDMSITLYNGSNHLQAQAMDNVIIYAGNGGKSLHVMFYNNDNAGFVSAELSKDAGHMTIGGIASYAIMMYPDPIIWIAGVDGLLRSCTFDMKEGAVAWARHPMGEGAFVESVATGKGSDDVLWLVVKRGSVRTVEYLSMNAIDSIDDAFYVDCGLEIDQTASTTVTGLDHLVGYGVVALGDNSPLSLQTVPVGGELTYDRELENVRIGIPYTSKGFLLRPELPANGTSQGKKRKVDKQTIRFYQSLGGSVGSDLDNLRPIVEIRPGTYTMDNPVALVTGDREVDIPSYVTVDGRVYITQDVPLPMNILSVMTRYSVLEG